LRHPFSYSIFLLTVLLCSMAGHAQNLSLSDSLFFQNLQRELQPSVTLKHQIDSIYRIPLLRLQQIDKEINRISRTDIPQAEKDNIFKNLRLEKSQLKEERELSILLLLSSEQQVIYKEKILPTKPAVLHMGSNHDRASCTVCIRPSR
jgi:hypothetical protein